MRQFLRRGARDPALSGNVPLRAAEAEAVRKLALQSIPELLLFLFRELEQRVVKVFELLVLLLQRRIVTPGVAAITASASATATTTATILAL